MTSDDSIRFKLLRRTHDTLNKLIDENQRDISKFWAHKLTNRINLEQAVYSEAMISLLSAKDLAEFMVVLLALKVKEESYIDSEDIENILYQDIYKLAQPDDFIQLGDANDYQKWENNLKEFLNRKDVVYSDTHYIDFIAKIFYAVDFSDPLEQELATDIWKLLCKKFFVKNILSNDAAKHMNRFFEISMKKDLSGLLNDLLSDKPIQSSTILELQRLNAQVSLRKNRDELDNNLEN